MNNHVTQTALVLVASVGVYQIVNWAIHIVRSISSALWHRLTLPRRIDMIEGQMRLILSRLEK